MLNESRVAGGARLAELDPFLRALDGALGGAGYALEWSPGSRRFKVSWAYQPGSGVWAFVPDGDVAGAVFGPMATKLGALLVLSATCGQDGSETTIGFDAHEVTGHGEPVPVDVEMDPDELEAATSGPPDERVGQVLRSLIGFEEARSDVSHDLWVFAPAGGNELAAEAPTVNRDDLAELVEQADNARRVVIARIGEDAYRVTFIDVLVKLRENRPAIPLARSRAEVNGADMGVIRDHLERIGGRKLAGPSVRPLDLEEQLFDLEADDLEFGDDDELDAAGEAFALDLFAGSSELKSLLREFLPQDESSRAPSVSETPSVIVHPDAIVPSVADARKLLEILVKEEALELDAPPSLEALVQGVFEIGARCSVAEEMASELSEWLLDQPSVEELYIDDDKLSQFLRIW